MWIDFICDAVESCECGWGGVGMCACIHAFIVRVCAWMHIYLCMGALCVCIFSVCFIVVVVLQF